MAKPGKEQKIGNQGNKARKLRIFADAEIRFVRMGRVIGTLRGSYATLDLAKASVEVERAEAEVANALIRADRIELDLNANRLSAEGRVDIEEQGVKLTAHRMTAAPSFTRVRFEGGVSLRAKNRDSARALVDSGLI